ncbi:MAG: hypothetical protein AB7I41_21050 [Candidatus Sericytochromatia bacterium]
MPDSYFSPNGDGAKDTLPFEVFSRLPGTYTVEIQHKGKVLKSWPKLLGNQSLNWDGLSNGQRSQAMPMTLPTCPPLMQKCKFQTCIMWIPFLIV